MNIIKNYYYGLEIKKNTPKINSGKINKTNNNFLVLLNYIPNRWSIAYTKGLTLKI